MCFTSSVKWELLNYGVIFLREAAQTPPKDILLGIAKQFVDLEDFDALVKDNHCGYIVFSSDTAPLGNSQETRNSVLNWFLS